MTEGLAALSSVLPSCRSSSFAVVNQLGFTRIAQAQIHALHSSAGVSRAGGLGGSLPLKCRDGSNRSVSKKTFQVLCSQVADSSTVVSPGTKPVSSKIVLVVGATGRVGQLIVVSLLEKGVKVRALLRNAEKARSLFDTKSGDQFEFRIGDLRQPDTLDESIFEGITHVVNATGTTAFPTKRWIGNNVPEQIDWIGVRNLVDLLPKTVERVLLLSSIGVTKYNEFPWIILNLFGVLKYKKMGEDHLRNSGIPFTIIRPGQLTDEQSATRRDVILGQGDKLVGDATRVVVAEACVHALDLKCTECQTYEIISVEGEGPEQDAEKWASLFEALHST